MFKVILICILMCAASNVVAGEAYLLHTLKEGSTVTNVLRRLKLAPLFGLGGQVTRTLMLNPHVKELGAQDLPVGTVIVLPLTHLAESEAWFVKDRYVYFKNQSRVPTAKNEHSPIKESRWLASLNLGTSFLNTQLLDSTNLKGNVSTQKSFNHAASLIYKKNKSYWYELKYQSQDRSYSSSSTATVNNAEIRRESVELMGLYHLSPKQSFGWALGLQDSISFLSDSSSSVSLITGKREFIGLVTDFKLMLKESPVFLKGQFNWLPEKSFGAVDFKSAFEFKVKASSSLKINSKTDFIYEAELIYLLEDSQTYKQNTSGSHIRFGLRWEL